MEMGPIVVFFGERNYRDLWIDCIDLYGSLHIICMYEESPEHPNSSVEIGITKNIQQKHSDVFLFDCSASFWFILLFQGRVPKRTRKQLESYMLLVASPIAGFPV